MPQTITQLSHRCKRQATTQFKLLLPCELGCCHATHVKRAFIQIQRHLVPAHQVPPQHHRTERSCFWWFYNLHTFPLMQLAGFWEALTKSTEPRKLGSLVPMLCWTGPSRKQSSANTHETQNRSATNKIIHASVHATHSNNHRNAFAGWQTAGPHGLSNWQATLPICSLCHQRDLDWRP